MPTRLLAAFSGGLDSMLAVLHMRKLGFHIHAVQFCSPFLGWKQNDQDLQAYRQRMEQQLDIELELIDITHEHIEMVRRPQFGYGANINPCLDCKALFWDRLHALMECMESPVIITGDVMGQRPMTQHQHQLERLERITGLQGRILRPLSGRLLAPTVLEQQGSIARDDLLDFRGRSRKPQIELAREYGIQDFPSPAGGCQLTVPGSAARIAQLLHSPFEEFSAANIRLLPLGRHFMLDRARLVVARNGDEVCPVKELTLPGDALLEMSDRRGALALLRGAITDDNLATAARILARYSHRSRERGAWPCATLDQGEREFRTATPIDEEHLEQLRFDAL